MPLTHDPARAAPRRPRAAGRALAAAVALAALAAVAATAGAQHEHVAPAARVRSDADRGTAPLLKGMGRLHRPVTTSSPLAQRYFDQGLSLAYAFNHTEARRSFAEALKLDSTCAMCAWGVAYVLGPNINAPMDTAANREARAAAERATRLAAARGTAVERALAAAMARRYATTPPASRAPLDSAYAAAMRDVAGRYPEDADAAALYAEAQMNLSPWNYWTAERQPRPGTGDLLAALERGMRLDANHPGACHFYIHAVEAAFPARAVACAERLAALMPAAGHIVHMPGHIYLRVGRYADAIRANEHAVHADESYIADQGVQSFYTVGYYPHNYHFLSFAATMAGRRDKALSAARRAAGTTPLDAARGAPELQLLVAYPHLTLVTFGEWGAVLREPLPAAGLPLANGLAWYARGTALAARGRWAEAGAARDSVVARQAAVTQQPGAAVLAIAAQSLAGEIAAGRGRHDAAVAHLTEAMRGEDALGYMEPPYWHRPVRQRLGAVLLAAGRPAEAERRFREDLERFPENVWSKRGLARARAAQEKRVAGRG